MSQSRRWEDDYKENNLFTWAGWVRAARCIAGRSGRENLATRPPAVHTVRRSSSSVFDRKLNIWCMQWYEENGVRMICICILQMWWLSDHSYDLEHDQVDQVDNGDNKTHKKETLKWEEGSHNIDVQSNFHDPWLWCFEQTSHLCLLDGELTEAAEEDGDDPGEHVPRTRPHVGTQLRWGWWWWWWWWWWWCLKTLISFFYTLDVLCLK